MWKAYHIYIHDYNAIDEFMKKEFFDFISENISVNQKYFFLRYWLGGPHIRLRVEANENFDESQFIKNLKYYLDSFLEQATINHINKETFYSQEMLEGEDIYQVYWKKHGTLEKNSYTPEVQRYGGDYLMRKSEYLFYLSSNLCLHLNKLSYFYRIINSIDLIYFSFSKMSNSQKLMKEYSELWRKYKKNHEVGESLYPLVKKRITLLQKNYEKYIAVYKTYLDYLHEFPIYIKNSHIHMTNNRLGVHPEMEYYISLYLSFMMEGEN